MSGIILMVNALRLKRSGRAVNVEKDLELARAVIQMLRSLRYQCVDLHCIRGLTTKPANDR